MMGFFDLPQLNVGLVIFFSFSFFFFLFSFFFFLISSFFCPSEGGIQFKINSISRNLDLLFLFIFSFIFPFFFFFSIFVQKK